MTPYDWHAHRLEQWLKRLAWLLGLSALVVIGLYYAVQVMSPPSPLAERSASVKPVAVTNTTAVPIRCLPESMGTPTATKGFIIEPGEKLASPGTWHCVEGEPAPHSQGGK